MSMSFEQASEEAGARMNACLLCCDLPAYLGCFIPKSEPERYIAIKLAGGKTRVLWYGLCESCYALPDKAERVEDVLEAAATRERN